MTFNEMLHRYSMYFWLCHTSQLGAQTLRTGCHNVVVHVVYDNLRDVQCDFSNALKWIAHVEGMLSLQLVLFQRIFDKTQWWDRREMLSERGLSPLCSHDYLRNIQGYTHTQAVLYVCMRASKRREKRTGLISCYFILSLPRKALVSVALETTI